jgi:hypothetical protein
VQNLTQEAIAGLAAWATSIHSENEELTLTARSSEVLPDILRHLVAAGADVYALKPERLSLEELFLRIMGEDRGL